MTPARSDIADRFELRSLVEAYARHVDDRDVDAVAALFTEDGRMLAHLAPGTEVEPLVREGREKVRRAIAAGLEVYLGTTHVIGAQVVEIHGTAATGTTTCLAHHVYEDTEGNGRRMLLMAIRYEDRYRHEDGSWRFAERRLRLDWRDDRPLHDTPAGQAS